MTPKEKGKIKVKMSQYNAAFNLSYDAVLLQLAEHFYQNDTIESPSKYGIANFSILRTLFDYVDEVIEDWEYTPEQLVQLIDEHDKLKNKFEQKLLALAGETQEKIDETVANIEVD